MDEVRNFRRWDELIPEALCLIFKNLSVVERLSVVPSVCKSWGGAVLEPYCWQEIDILEWSLNHKPEHIDRMLRLLISRNCGSLQKLCVFGLASEESFMFIASHAQSLQTLRLMRTEIDDSIIERAAGMLSSVTFLDLSFCVNLGAEALEAIGKHCKSLTSLLWEVNPCEPMKWSFDGEARAIAATMPNLKFLYIPCWPVDTSSVVSIIENCKQLELLYIQGCSDVNLDENFLKSFPNLLVFGDHPVTNKRDDIPVVASAWDYIPIPIDWDGNDFDDILEAVDVDIVIENMQRCGLTMM